MKSSILSVGTELLFGETVNTNSVYLSQQLNLLGIDVMSHHTVGDNSRRLADIMRQTFKECDLILTSGGLGPTQDDITKEIACEVLEDQMVPHGPSMDKLESYFKRLGREMTDNNWKQAYFPSRASVFDNDIGTAPGFALEHKGKTIICMPGPPRELIHMFERHVRPYLGNMTDSAIYYKTLRLFGIGESKLETELLDLINGQTDPTIATYAKEGECSVRVASKRRKPEDAEAAVAKMVNRISDKVGSYIYSFDGEEYHQVVAKELLNRNISFASAESCTGGLFAKTMTDIPGISRIFDRCLVTYSNRAKQEELQVSRKTLGRFGAVSMETAVEMAEGLKKITGCRLCISVTGIAGPESESETKPVGLTYICAIFDGKRLCSESKIRNVSRVWNRNYAKLLMLDMVNRIIKEQ